MKTPKPVEWSKLDNAAKIFPPTSNKRDTKVFRFCCELYEPVDAEILQTALDKTIMDFPLYRSILKRGMFWYYFEDSPLKPLVHRENAPPCSPIYDQNRKTLLFEVTYYHCRINLEVYHALSDGTGALQFLKTMVYHYLLMKHADDFAGLTIPSMDYDASLSQKMDDSFQKYYDAKKAGKSRAAPAAYQLQGVRLAENRLRIIEGITSVKKMLEKAHEYHTTITVLLVTVLICAIHDEMSLRSEEKPVVITIPVNLRKYFRSESTRNFFGIINVGYKFKGNSSRFDDILAHIHKAFEEELTAEQLANRMNELITIERNALTRIVPLVIKDVGLRAANSLTNRTITAALSNIGKVDMPELLRPYIHLFDVFVSTNRVQMCMCSFQDNMVLSFASPFVSTDIQRRFFRYLTEMGLPIEIISNQAEEDRKQEN